MHLRSSPCCSAHAKQGRRATESAVSKLLTHVCVHYLLRRWAACRRGLMAGMMWCVLWQTWGHCQMHGRRHKLQPEPWVCVPVTLWVVGQQPMVSTQWWGCGRRILGCCPGSKQVCDVTYVSRSLAGVCIDASLECCRAKPNLCHRQRQRHTQPVTPRSGSQRLLHVPCHTTAAAASETQAAPPQKGKLTTLTTSP